ncbi:MAG: N-acetyl-alpha-D-glucosaminyl L-malate synthase BshA [Bacteroidia bacterium]|nr:N-acetyl-alpha-D-glucosaminyl L-malate synthase BshA [Bacteroidia bacterium]
MKIGIVCYPTYGGSGVIATELGKCLAQKGYEVHFITYNRPIRLDLFMENIYYHEVTTPNYPLFESLPYESALASKLVDVVKYYKLDLLHVHYAIPHASVAYLARQILRTFGINIPVIVTLHGTDITLVGKDKSFEPVVSFAINQSNGVTAVSEFLRKDTFDNFHITNEITVIPNFVDIQRFRRHSKEHFRKMLTTKGEKIIIHTSNFRKVKRVEDVIRVFEVIQKNIPAKLLMIGDGPQRKPAEDLSRELGVFDDIYFLGSQDPVEELYSIGDLFLLPSESETFGLAALEAMACGIPVITTSAGGLTEVVQDGISGYCCQVGDYRTMGERALELLSDDEKWKSFSVSARKIAESFSVENITPLYEELYRKIIETQTP